MRTSTKTELREIARLVDRYIGKRGLCWGEGRGGKTHVVIHEGDGAAGGYSAVTLVGVETAEFADKFVRSLINAEQLPAIASFLRVAEWPLKTMVAQLTDETQILRWRIMHLEAELARKVPPYSDETAIVPLEQRRAS